LPLRIKKIYIWNFPRNSDEANKKMGNSPLSKGFGMKKKVEKGGNGN
jgi:hypothetical protein